MNCISHNALYLRLIAAQVFLISVVYISCHPPGTLCEVLFYPSYTSEHLSWYYWSSVYDQGLFIWPCDSLPPALVIWSLDCLLLLLSAACLDLSLVKRLWVWTCLYHPCRCYLIFACLTLSFNKSCKWIHMPQTLRYRMSQCNADFTNKNLIE